ncbi:MAG: hypothetical protein IJM61_00120 [Firmicutes bacterium]|nr:hypothetical protein [Bacillota bacterium]
MKGKTAFKIAVIGALLYGIYCVQKDRTLIDTEEDLDAERRQFREDLEKDIRKVAEAADDLASSVKAVVAEALNAGSEGAPEEDPDAAPGADQDVPEAVINDDIGPEHVGIANPFKELTEAEFVSACPRELNYADIDEDDPFFYTIDGDKTIYGIRLRDADCLEYDFRMVHGRGDADISGMHYDWTQEIKYPENKPECTVYLNDSGQGICLWKDRSYRYSLSLKEGASLVKLAWMRKRIITV